MCTSEKVPQIFQESWFNQMRENKAHLSVIKVTKEQTLKRTI